MKGFYNYKPSKTTKEFVMKFSKDVVETTKGYISGRNQNNVPKMIMDHYYGKLGELAIWHYFTKHLNKEMLPPDFKITKNKSFDCDLKHENYEIHVKSQHITSSNRFGLSWMLQKWDKLVTNPKQNQLYGFCLVQEDESVNILKIVKADDIQYGEPMLEKLRANKTVIYYDRNEHLPNFML